MLARRQRIETEDLPPQVGVAVPTAIAAADVKRLADIERDHFGGVLRAVGGNRTQAAAKLGIGPATLYRKLKQYDELGDQRKRRLS